MSSRQNIGLVHEAQFILNTHLDFHRLLFKVFNMFSVDDVVVATKGVDLGQMVVVGLSSGGAYVHVKVDGMSLTYPVRDVKKA